MTEPIAVPSSSPPAPLCSLEELPDGAARTFELLRRKKSGKAVKWPIFVVRARDGVFGYVNKCPHQPVPLDWDGNRILDTAAQQLQCGKHGARFELSSGRCLEGPCLGETLQPVALRIDAGSVFVESVELVTPGGAS